MASIAEIDGLTIPSGSVTPPLDTYTGAVAGYSVRLLRTAYTGDIMRVRRASDSVEADVGFDSSNELSLTSPISNTSDAQSYTDLADFVDHTGTPSDAFVRYWYDQASSNDAGQATSTAQPQIYDASTGLIDRSSKVSVFVPLTAALRSTTGSMTQPNSTFICADFVSGKVIDASTGRRTYELKSGGNFAMWTGSQPYTTTTGGGYAGTGNLQLISTVLDGSSTTHKLNNATPETRAAGTNSSTGFYFGGQVGVAGGELYVSEFIAYESDESTDQSDIVSNQNDYFRRY